MTEWRGNIRIVNIDVSKERPILFSAPMVRAILEGRKTQTRRIIKIQPPTMSAPSIFFIKGADTSLTPVLTQHSKGYAVKWIWQMSKLGQVEYFQTYSDGGPNCPYGQPGDRLWVRESWNQQGCWGAKCEEPEAQRDYQWHGSKDIHFPADGKRPEPTFGRDWRGRPSIHMPRWASRIDLEVAKVRVERLQDIGEEDASAEGCGREGTAPVVAMGKPSRLSFCFLWEEINGNGSWDANPWVWVIEFKVIRPNLTPLNAK